MSEPQNNLTNKFMSLSLLMQDNNLAVTNAIASLQLAQNVQNTQMMTLLQDITTSIDSVVAHTASILLLSQSIESNTTASSALLSEIKTTLEDTYAVTQDIASQDAYLQRIALQLDESIVRPTVKDLLATISQQQRELAAKDSALLAPTGGCNAPVKSAGLAYLPISGSMVEPVTVANWVPADLPPGITAPNEGIISGYSALASADWGAYKIYVASRATEYGVKLTSAQRFPTNTWQIFAGGDTFEFFVVGAEALTVHICGASDVLGDCNGAVGDPLSHSGWYARPDADGNAQTRIWEGGAWGSGGTTWALNGQIPQVGQSLEAFLITRTGVPGVEAAVCVSWTLGGALDLGAAGYIGLSRWHQVAGGWQLDGGTTLGFEGASGAEQDLLLWGSEYAYTLKLVATEPLNAPPPLSVKIDLVELQ